jgi:hypothetical protein
MDEAFAKSDHARAKGVRNGLMIAILALCPIRLKNFAALELGRTFLDINGDPRVTEDYNRASSMSAVLDYAGITDTFRCK